MAINTYRYIQTFLLVFTVNAYSEVAVKDIFDLDLLELMQIKVSSATLTKTSLRTTPSAITHISRADIDNSGARNLDELLRIYVPGFQHMRKENGDSIGFRGVISDRNDKLILLVNGKVMNEHTIFGVMSERMISMLSDIDYINVIRGPGSVIYGSGAIAGIIDIVTFNGDSYTGSNIKLRKGFVEEFSSLEYRFGKEFSRGIRLFMYFGIDKYEGADTADAPHKYSHSFISNDGFPVEAGKAVPFDTPNDGEAYRDRHRYKAHLQLTSEHWDTWLRYTRGGRYTNPKPSDLRRSQESRDNQGIGYQQLTLFTEFNKELNETLSFQLRLSYDINDSEHPDGSKAMRSHREDEYYTRMMLNWAPKEQHRFAFGIEFSHEEYGRRSPGFPHQPAFINNDIPASVGRWNSRTYSFLSEYQWILNEQWTMFTGLRIDDNSNFSETMFSPRLALIYTATEKDILKLIYNRSSRIPVASARIENIANDADNSDPEIINNYEIRWERQQNEHVWFGFSGYYADHEVTGHNVPEHTTEVLGKVNYYGLEFETKLQRNRYTISLAHNYTKLIDFDLEDPTLIRQHVSSSPYGFGSDFTNWSNHQTTFSGRYEFTEQLIGNASLTALWGYPGAEDYADYNRANGIISAFGLPNADPGENRAFEESIYLNSSLEYHSNDSLSIRLDAYNILGWIDKDYNKRSTFLRSGAYQNEAAALAVTLGYTF